MDVSLGGVARRYLDEIEHLDGQVQTLLRENEKLRAAIAPMTELSDYKRMVEQPMLAAKDATIARIKNQRDIAQRRADYLQQVIEDAIEALERNSTAAPALEILKATVLVEH